MARIKKLKELKSPKPKEMNPLGMLLSGKSEAQNQYIDSVKANMITFVHGPPGSGKTYLATLYALNEFFKGVYDKIIVTRPYVEACGEKIGYLPGDLHQKISSLLMPVTDIIEEKIKRETTERLLRDKQIFTIPMGYLRGVTFKKTFVIVDEAQSATIEQIRLVLTRIGEKSKIVITGDLNQSDIRGMNGLQDAIHRLEGIEGIGIVKLDESSIVRHPLIAEIERRYSK